MGARVQNVILPPDSMINAKRFVTFFHSFNKHVMSIALSIS